MANTEERKTFLDFLQSEGKQGDWLFNGDVIVGGFTVPHSLVWEYGMDVKEYGREKFAELLNSEYEITKVNINGYDIDVIEIFCGNRELGEEFFSAAAGYIGSKEYDRIFADNEEPINYKGYNERSETPTEEDKALAGVPAENTDDYLPKKTYDLGYGHFGNGYAVWNRAEEVNGDYKTVAQINSDRSVEFYDSDMPAEYKQSILKVAWTSEAKIEPNKRIFHVPPLSKLNEIQANKGKFNVISKIPKSLDCCGKFMIAPEDFIKNDFNRSIKMDNVWLPVVFKSSWELFDFQIEHQNRFQKAVTFPEQAYTLDEIKEIIADKRIMEAAYNAGLDVKAFRNAKAEIMIKRELIQVAEELQGHYDFFNNSENVGETVKNLYQTKERIPEHFPMLSALVSFAAESVDFSMLKERMEILQTEFIQHYKTVDISKEQAKTPQNSKEEKIMDIDSKSMDIKATVYPIENSESSLKANAKITINDNVAIRDIKIYERTDSEGRTFTNIGMPSRKGEDEKYHDVAFPITSDLRNQIIDTVLAKYYDTLANGIDENQRGLEPSDLSVKVTNMKFGGREDGNFKAACQVVLNDSFVITDIKVMDGKKGLFAAMPSKQDEFGEDRNIAHTITSDFNAVLQAAVIEKYNAEKESIIGNTHKTALGNKENLRAFKLNAKFSEKVGGQLNEAGIKWSGEANKDGTINIIVHKKDVPALEKAVIKAREIAKEAKGKIHDKIANPPKQEEKADRQDENTRKRQKPSL